MNDSIDKLIFLLDGLNVSGIANAQRVTNMYLILNSMKKEATSIENTKDKDD